MSIVRLLILLSMLGTMQLFAFWPFITQKPFSIMLDPAGDARTTGRTIDDSFERGITLQCAEALKQRIESQHPNVRVVLTRVPGETIAPLQNANFSNRLAVDLYISIHFYHEHEAKPSLYIYHFLYNPITDLWAKPRRMFFYPYDMAQIFNVTKTTVWAENIKTTLSSYKQQFDVKGVYGIPFRPLIGIQAPAFALEIGLRNKQCWQQYLDPLAQSIDTLLKVIG